MKKVIVYYTDNNLQYALAKKCRSVLLENSGGIEIVAISQKPILKPENFGKNIVVGRIGRSMLNMYTQILTGLKATDADIVYLAEHDVLYTKEHFQFTPEPDCFYYNTNLWFLDWNNKSRRKGLYFPSVNNRPALSQLVCHKTILVNNILKRLEIFDMGFDISRGISGACEPGICDEKAFAYGERICGFKSDHTHKYFETLSPNVDIRNGQNFTGFRRVKESLSTYDLAPWGRFSI